MQVASYKELTLFKLMEILAYSIMDNANTFIVDDENNYIASTEYDVDCHKIFMDKAISDYRLRSIPIYKKKKK